MIMRGSLDGFCSVVLYHLVETYKGLLDKKIETGTLTFGIVTASKSAPVA